MRYLLRSVVNGMRTMVAKAGRATSLLPQSISPLAHHHSTHYDKGRCHCVLWDSYEDIREEGLIASGHPL